MASLMKDIVQPRETDIICARGGAALQHAGNQTYRRLVNLNKGLYMTSLKTEKKKISQSIVAVIREQKGRFLQRDDNKGVWFDIGDKKAVEKTSHELEKSNGRIVSVPTSMLKQYGNGIFKARGQSSANNSLNDSIQGMLMSTGMSIGSVGSGSHIGRIVSVPTSMLEQYGNGIYNAPGQSSANNSLNGSMHSMLMSSGMSIGSVGSGSHIGRSVSVHTTCSLLEQYGNGIYNAPGQSSANNSLNGSMLSMLESVGSRSHIGSFGPASSMGTIDWAKWITSREDEEISENSYNSYIRRAVSVRRGIRVGIEKVMDEEEISENIRRAVSVRRGIRVGIEKVMDEEEISINSYNSYIRQAVSVLRGIGVGIENFDNLSIGVGSQRSLLSGLSKLSWDSPDIHTTFTNMAKKITSTNHTISGLSLPMSEFSGNSYISEQRNHKWDY